MNVIKQYDRIGLAYIKGAADFFSKEKDYSREFIKKNLPDLKVKKVIDIGCGGGKDIEFFENQGAGEVFGIDTSKLMVKEARKIVKKPENIFCKSIEKTHFQKEYFDIAVARFSLHYLRKLDKAYAEIARILKPKGKLLLVVAHPLSHSKIRKKNKKGLVEVRLYNNKVKVVYPDHSFNDYLSETFLRKFILERFEELEGKETSIKPKRSSGGIGITAVKR